MAVVLASTRAGASPVAVEDTDSMMEPTPTSITSNPPTTPMHYTVPEPTFVELEGPDGIFVEVESDWIVGIAKHKGPKKHHHKDKKKNECQHDVCQECVHRCGEMRGFPCIYFQCLPKLCKNCNLVITHPSRHSSAPASAATSRP
ncbi:hypothetical protein FHL15_011029 [Xylaria flabelliformis]|uniref:Uncharacterized protein n=1 Tax=Xylaria flabelliformis TaxID=2512241 RepID=A0A553HJF3_9PEZI|nr:hypothetical protein FHL15_011029 [Xylaria flabelliformis]